MSSLSDKEPSAKKYISSMQEGDSVAVQNAISENLVNVDFKGISYWHTRKDDILKQMHYVLSQFLFRLLF